MVMIICSFVRLRPGRVTGSVRGTRRTCFPRTFYRGTNIIILLQSVRNAYTHNVYLCLRVPLLRESVRERERVREKHTQRHETLYVRTRNRVAAPHETSRSPVRRDAVPPADRRGVDARWCTAVTDRAIAFPTGKYADRAICDGSGVRFSFFRFDHLCNCVWSIRKH